MLKYPWKRCFAVGNEWVNKKSILSFLKVGHTGYEMGVRTSEQKIAVCWESLWPLKTDKFIIFLIFILCVYKKTEQQLNLYWQVFYLMNFKTS